LILIIDFLGVVKEFAGKNSKNLKSKTRAFSSAQITNKRRRKAALPTSTHRQVHCLIFQRC